MLTPIQTGFADLEYPGKKRPTRRELFLAEREQVVPGSLLLAELEPHYPGSGRRGRQPMSLARMRRIPCLRQGFSYSDRRLEEAWYEIDSVRRFAGL
jgi:IS5 family transposase